MKVDQKLARHEEPFRITSRRPEAERDGRRQGGRSRQPVSGLAMQPDAACDRRSRPKPEGYPDRLSPTDADPRPLRPRSTGGPDPGVGCAARHRVRRLRTSPSAGHQHRRRISACSRCPTYRNGLDSFSAFSAPPHPARHRLSSVVRTGGSVRRGREGRHPAWGGQRSRRRARGSQTMCFYRPPCI